MKLTSVFLALLFLMFSCKKSRKTNSESARKTRSETETIQNKDDRDFNFDQFKIEKGHLGPIKIGMTLSAAEKEIKPLTKKECEAYDFGYDGGGKAYIYYLQKEPILALVPKMHSEEILVIIALSKNLKTDGGLHPKATVKELQKQYSNIEVNQDLMMQWEFMHDEKNRWNFIFMTDDNNRIGEYKDLEVPTRPIRTTIAMDWITIL